MPSLVEIGRMIFGKRFFKVCYFAIMDLALRALQKECLVPGLVNNKPVFNLCHCIFANFPIIPIIEKWRAHDLNLNTFKSPSPKDALCQVWPGS